MIPVSQPWLTSREKQYVSEAVDSGWISSSGPFIKRFEEAFASYIGVKFALACNNGTSACHLALAAAGIGPGAVVAVPAVTFIATANAARYCDAEIKLIDIDPHTWNAEPDSEALAGATAFFLVHLYGNMVRSDRLNGVILEDSCEALGGSYRGKMAGSIGKTSAFSFFGNKTISTGEGGMFCTSDPDCYELARLYWGQGQTERRYYHSLIGYNYRMTNIQAALGLAQLERIDEILAEKTRVYQRYHQRLSGAVGVQREPPHSVHSKWAVTIRVGNRNRLMRALKIEGIDSRPAFVPLPLLPPYKADPALFPNAIALGEEGVTLPSYCELSNDDVDRICNIVLRHIQ